MYTVGKYGIGLDLQPFPYPAKKNATRVAGCLQPPRFLTVSAVNVQTCLNGYKQTTDLLLKLRRSKMAFRPLAERCPRDGKGMFTSSSQAIEMRPVKCVSLI